MRHGLLILVAGMLVLSTATGQQAGEKGPLVQGVAMVQSQLLDALQRHGVTVISEPDSGIYAALAKGLQRATADDLAYLDAEPHHA